MHGPFIFFGSMRNAHGKVGIAHLQHANSASNCASRVCSARPCGHHTLCIYEQQALTHPAAACKQDQ